MDNLDHTVIKPRPGGRKKNAVEAPPVVADNTVITPRKRTPGGAVAPLTPVQSGGEKDATFVTPRKKGGPKTPVVLSDIKSFPRIGSSPLITAASELLAIPPQLRQITGNIDVHQLHNLVKLQVQAFENQAISVCDDSQIRIDSSYILCALIDETVLNTPWGEHSHWSQNPMLSIFHHETYGGERVYDILGYALQSPSRYEDILELVYLAFSLGFMGKYRVEPQGALKIEQNRSQIYELLNRSRSELQLALSPKIQPLTGFSNRLHSFLPYWIVTALLVLLAFSVYSYWLLQLNKQSDTTLQVMSAIVPEKNTQTISTQETPKPILALHNLLADEIARDVLRIEDYLSHTAITLPNSALFSSGSAEVNKAIYPILDKIAKALEAIPGKVIVTGHTDDRAIRTTVYPSNWHLSLARASAVVKYMDSVATLDSRLLPEGRGSEQPIAENTTPDGRALNRRVVIDIYYPRSGMPVDKES